MNKFEHVNSKGVTYYLNTKDVTLKNNLVTTIYFFTKQHRPVTSTYIPYGWEVFETSRNLPMLRKIKEV